MSQDKSYAIGSQRSLKVVYLYTHRHQKKKLGESVTHSESTGSWKLWLSMIKHSHHMGGDHLVLGLACKFSWSQTQCRLYTPGKSFRYDYKQRSCVSTHAKRSDLDMKDPAVHVRVRWTMETLKHPACTAGWVTQLLQLTFPRENDVNSP